MMIALSRRIAASEVFQTFILWIIILTAISMGLETVPEFEDAFAFEFELFFYLTQAIFAVEMVIRLIAYAPRFTHFFKEFWNTFDFVIVAASFFPGAGAFAPVIRLLRILRVLRVLSVSDRLRGFLDRMHRTIDELLYSGLIVFILGYIFTIAGNYLFFDIDPTRWGSLGRAALSVFYLLLLQGVPQFVDGVIVAARMNVLYFVVFYAVFFSLFVNLVTAISTEHKNDSAEADTHG